MLLKCALTRVLTLLIGLGMMLSVSAQTNTTTTHHHKKHHTTHHHKKHKATHRTVYYQKDIKHPVKRPTTHRLHKTAPIAYHPLPPIPVTGMAKPGSEVFDRQFQMFMHQWRLPGGAIAVIKNDQLVYSRGYGWADVSARIPVQPDSLFRIASVSKLITATTILKLAQDHKLNLNDKVFNILSDLKPIDGKTVNPQIYNITILDLLHMSSGWFSAGAGHLDPMFGPWPRYMENAIGKNNLPASCETMTRMMMSQSMRSRPGTAYVYSNMDYCILGLIVDKVTGYSDYSYLGYQNYVKNMILAPLDIHNMAIGSTRPEQRMPGEVDYYRYSLESTEELANSTYLPYSTTDLLHKNFANGGWVASAIDLAKFMHALSHRKILDEKSLSIMTAKPSYLRKPRNDYFAMGTKVYYMKDGVYWIQTGSFTGTNAMVVNKPDGTSIAVIFNTRPSMYNFFSRFRPELKALLLSKHLAQI